MGKWGSIKATTSLENVWALLEDEFRSRVSVAPWRDLNTLVYLASLASFCGIEPSRTQI